MKSTKTRTALVAASLLTVLGAAALLSPTAQGQQPAVAAGDVGEGLLLGKTATIEYRPVPTEGGRYLSKQRIAVIRKMTPEWLVLDDQGMTVAVPREMVLEIRIAKQ